MYVRLGVPERGGDSNAAAQRQLIDGAVEALRVERAGQIRVRELSRGSDRPLATWSVAADGHLEGAISLPTAVGIVGGATKVQPAARLALQLLGSQACAMLGQVMAAVGLASNLAALRALATEGIQRGHMGLHARSVAVGAGAVGHEIEILVTRLIESGEVKHEHAVLLLRHLRQ